MGACAQGIPYYDSTGNGSFSVNATLLSATSQLKYVSGRAAAALLQVIHISGCVCCRECYAFLLECGTVFHQARGCLTAAGAHLAIQQSAADPECRGFESG